MNIYEPKKSFATKIVDKYFALSIFVATIALLGINSYNLISSIKLPKQEQYFNKEQVKKMMKDFKQSNESNDPDIEALIRTELQNRYD